MRLPWKKKVEAPPCAYGHALPSAIGAANTGYWEGSIYACDRCGKKFRLTKCYFGQWTWD